MNQFKSFIFLLLTTLIWHNEVKCQKLERPSEGNAMVYFVRFRGAVAVIDFKYYDGQKYLGKGGGNNYYYYECEPGEHVFWVSAENREYVKGDLKPNGIYIIEVRPFFRAVSSGVELYPVSPEDKKTVKKIESFIEKNDPKTLKRSDDDKSKQIEGGMERLNSIESKIKVIDTEWVFDF